MRMNQVRRKPVFKKAFCMRKVFDHVCKYHMKLLFRDFNSKFGREDTFKLTIWKESLHQDGNDNGDRILTLPHQKI
jgi:hypothetical protein